MKYVALVSGGKDSFYAIMECAKLGHELVACVHLGRPTRPHALSTSGAGGNDVDAEEEEEEEESYMYQTAASEAVRTLVEECLEVPLVWHERKGRSVNTSLVYSGPTEHDEVEDLCDALIEAKRRFDFVGVSSGAILSTYQRVRVEHACSRLGLQSLAYLWRIEAQGRLLERMTASDEEEENGLDAVLVKVAAPPGLVPRRHLGQSLRDLHVHLQHLHAKYGVHQCGEGGEYETLVVNCPLFRHNRLVLDNTEVVEEGDGVGILRVHACHAEPKFDGTVVSTVGSQYARASHHHHNASVLDTPVVAAVPSLHCGDERDTTESLSPTAVPELTTTPPPPTTLPPPPLAMLPRVCRVAGGLLHVEVVAVMAAAEPAARSSLPSVSNDDDGADDNGRAAEEEALQVFQLLQAALEEHGCTFLDVAFVHLYLRQMADFARVNRVYKDFFGVSLPPSRSCVGLGDMLPQGRRVQLDCLAQCGSGDALRGVTRHEDNGNGKEPIPRRTAREVLHVQSLSHWAPVCVGPYSQANTLGGLHWVAGQIGLDPPTMTLRPDWEAQLRQAWRNLASVLDALGADLSHMVIGLVYTTYDVWARRGALDQLRLICREQRASNGGVVAGAIDGTRPDDEHDGYEDEETRQALSRGTADPTTNASEVPLLLVAVSELPVGAEVEVEAVATTRESHSSLQRTHVVTRETIDADSKQRGGAMFHLETWLLSLESGAVTNGLVAAFVEDECNAGVDTHLVLAAMMQALANVCAESTTHVPPALHLRLFYRGVDRGGAVVDDAAVRAAFHASLTLLGSDNDPATCIVPVKALSLLHKDSPTDGRLYLFAIEAHMIDPVRAETDLWIHEGRG